MVTFGPDGIYGHLDHVAISQFATAAVVASADATFGTGEGERPPTASRSSTTASARKATSTPTRRPLASWVMDIDGVQRRSQGWAPWQITTRVDTEAYWEQTWRAVEAHRTQLPGYSKLKGLPEAHHRNLWGIQEYYRAFQPGQWRARARDRPLRGAALAPDGRQGATDDL